MRPKYAGCHMDEVGLMVKTINKEGFLQFAKMGGIGDRIACTESNSIFEKGPFPGVVGSKPLIFRKRKNEKKS